jgi:peptidoglycan/xylan/chitin deacetylase (PgdA/CDA1 family)
MDSAVFLRTGFDALHFSGLAHASRKLFHGRGIILCLHHVRPFVGHKNDFAPNARLEITPEFLVSMIELVRHRGFRTVSMKDAVRELQAPTSNKSPFVVFTLDDGYKDNQVFAQPVFDRLNCPFTVFIAPNIVDGSCALWWRGIEEVIKSTLHFKAKIGTRQFDDRTETVAQKNTVCKQAALLLQNLPEYEQRQTITKIAQDYRIDLVAMCKAAAMSWDEIRTLNKDPLCTIGAHTLGHYAVARLSSDDARYEIMQSRVTVANELGEDVEFFAYPYGNAPAAGPRDFKIAEKAGFGAAVTTRKGVVHTEHQHQLWALPRIMVSGRFQKLRYIDVLISGLPTALANRFSKVNVS